jgi:virginiamycin A acetyltransferase
MPFDPALLHPHRLPDGTPNRCIVHLPCAVAQHNVTIGDFTYANDFDPPDDWRARLAPYLYPGAPERLIIGRYGAIAQGARFITASANHPLTGLSTYPFPIFDPGLLPLWEHTGKNMPDTVVGHDVWIGHGALVLPGARIGHGAIIGAGAVVGGVVPDYAVMGGNPARILRMRHGPDDIARLLDLGWWDWPPEQVRAALPALINGDLAALGSHPAAAPSL